MILSRKTSNGACTLVTLLLFVLLSPSARATDTLHLRCEAGDAVNGQPTRDSTVRSSTVSVGKLVSPDLPNQGSWQFDGLSSIAYAVPSNAVGFAENFTWEGFFLSPSSNKFLPETGIADRLLTQFAFDKGDWTRLAIGLVADGEGSPKLCVEIEGFEGRTFGMGDRAVPVDRWHHFGLVHEGTAAAATIRWYLDYELTGEIFLGGQANQNTLRPPGKARFTIGARLKSGAQVNRGFEGFIDEVRLTPRSLKINEFLRCEGASFEQVIDTARLGVQRREEFWKKRHQWAREHSTRWADPGSVRSSIDTFFTPPSEPIDDAAFLRRLSLTVRGRIPTRDEVESFLDDDRVGKRTRAIDRFLASPEWADGWVGYWQDVLAENPSVVFPTLNNSGAFRQWIYESFRDNQPFDRFATELLLMESDGSESNAGDSPASFSLATGNDAPMAMRSHVAMKAFAAIDLKCARCHDSPVDQFLQADLFLLAAYLNGEPLKVPASSVAAVGKAKETGLITTTLVAEQTIHPEGLTARWLGETKDTEPLNPFQLGPRAELAALLTSPRNSRFSDVIVNRVWERYFGSGLVEPVDQWNDRLDEAQPVLLRTLSAEFVASGYDMKALARAILMSKVWQSQRKRRQRMTAEQLVDSLFMAVGKDFQAETLGVHATDPGAVHLPRPHRAWQFAALPNERDRPALGMPVNQTIVDVMATFGWNGNRQQPRSEREQTTSALQPLILFNGLMSQRITRLSDQSAITELCLQDILVSTLVEQLFLGVLGRRPDDEERQHFTEYLSPGYEHRRTGEPVRRFKPLSEFQPDWRKHLEAEQTQLMLEARKRVASGEPPTARITKDSRERVEDVLWALINSPEFVVMP
ncbi:MAG: DUF1553 domain-containing protein [Planctomycetes bacterium]|nr:DUF1553 domain-containing protein [Planctomycetota bacterium]